MLSSTLLQSPFVSLIPFTISSSPNFFTRYLYHLIHPPRCRQKVRVLPALKEKRLPLMILPLRPWVERLPIPNQTIQRRKKGVVPQVMSVLFSSTHGMTLTSTFQWCLVTIRLLHQTMCGFPLVDVIPKFLGLPWLPLFLTSTSAKEPHYPCPFSLSLG